LKPLISAASATLWALLWDSSRALETRRVRSLSPEGVADILPPLRAIADVVLSRSDPTSSR